MKRYPLQPLIDALGLTHANLSRNELAARLHMDTTTLDRARRAGLLERFADLYACRAGFVPWLVWPEWITDVIEDCSIDCADPKCDRRFVPSRKGHRFCSKRCSTRARNRILDRKRYRNDPAYAERRRAARRQHYQECGDYERARVNEWREANAEKISAARRAYYQKNAEKERAKSRAYKEANAERERERRRAYYQKNRQRILARNRAYKAKRRTLAEAA